MLTEPTRLETVLRRDRTVVAAGIAALTCTAWVYLFSVASRMTAAEAVGVMGTTPEMAMPAMQKWGMVELLLLVAMWVIMMVAMMVPSVTPLVLLFARMNRQRGGNRIVGQAGLLLLGYLLVWAGFSVLATLAQLSLHSTALLSPTMVSTSSVFGGLLLIAAGVFQFTPLKRICLIQCRSPLRFLISYWEEGRWGPLLMGLKHGAYCVGCCWLLMVLVFVVGVMNLLWGAAIAILVLVEKVTPTGDVIGRIVGGTLIMAGIASIAR
jgi:predicted metal-binding membrane protein